MPGAGDVYEFLKLHKQHQVDLLITSDIKWNEQQLLNSQGIKFMMVPHMIENVFVENLSTIISNQFQDVEIIKLIERDFVKGY